MNSMKLTELMLLAREITYIPPSYDESRWTTDDIYHAAINETLQSKYQMKATEIICGVFSPLKLLFKTTLKNYINIMLSRRETQNNISA